MNNNMEWLKEVKGDSFMSRGLKLWSLGASYLKTYNDRGKDRLEWA